MIETQELLEVTQAIAVIEPQVDALKDQLERLEMKRVDLESKVFIGFHKITKPDVETPDGPGKPFFGRVDAFAEWMRTTHCPRRWAEWNGIIHNASELMAGKFIPTAGRVEHLKDL